MHPRLTPLVQAAGSSGEPPTTPGWCSSLAALPLAAVRARYVVVWATPLESSLLVLVVLLIVDRAAILIRERKRRA